MVGVEDSYHAELINNTQKNIQVFPVRGVGERTRRNTLSRDEDAGVIDKISWFSQMNGP